MKIEGTIARVLLSFGQSLKTGGRAPRSAAVVSPLEIVEADRTEKYVVKDALVLGAVIEEKAPSL